MGNTVTKKPSETNKYKDAIHKYVDKLLDDQDVNLRYLPDALEHRIYESLITLLIMDLKKTFESTRFEFMDHVITISIEPRDDLAHSEDKC